MLEKRFSRFGAHSRPDAPQRQCRAIHSRDQAWIDINSSTAFGLTSETNGPPNFTWPCIMTRSRRSACTTGRKGCLRSSARSRRWQYLRLTKPSSPSVAAISTAWRFRRMRSPFSTEPEDHPLPKRSRMPTRPIRSPGSLSTDRAGLRRQPIAVYCFAPHADRPVPRRRMASDRKTDKRCLGTVRHNQPSAPAPIR